MHSITGLHIYYFFGHLCEYQLHRTVFEKKPPIEGAGLLLLLEQGRRNEDNYVALLRQVTQVLSLKEGTMEERAERTLEAMRAGIPVLHNGVLDGADVSRALAATFAAEGVHVRFRGETDLLFRVDGNPSVFGDWSYVVADVKSSRTTKFPQMLQVAYYDWLLHAVQGSSVGEGRVIVFPEGPEKPPAVETFPMKEVATHLTIFLNDQLLPVLRQEGSRLPYHLVSSCRSCLWNNHCEQRSRTENNLSQLPGMRSAHKQALEDSGLGTVARLADTTDEQISAVIRAAQLSSEGGGRIRPQAIAFQRQERVVRAPVDEVVSNWLTENNRRFTNLSTPNWMNLHLGMLSDSLSGTEYGISVQIGKHPPQNFIAEETGQEDLIFYRFLDGMEKVNRHSQGRFRLFHFGPWEPVRLKRLVASHRPDARAFVEELILHMVDLQAIVRRAAYLPTRDTSLHSLVQVAAGAVEQTFKVPANWGELDARLETAGWEPSRFDEAREELTWAAQRIGVPVEQLLGLSEELPGVWYRMHLERNHSLWLTLIDFYQQDGANALKLLSEWAMSGGKEPTHVGV